MNQNITKHCVLSVLQFFIVRLSCSIWGETFIIHEKSILERVLDLCKFRTENKDPSRLREAEMSKLSDVPPIIEPGFDIPLKNGWDAKAQG